MVARLAARIGRLEAKLPPPEPGCDRCRGALVLGLGEYSEEEVDGRMVFRCAACRRQLTEGVRLIAIDLDAVI